MKRFFHFSIVATVVAITSVGPLAAGDILFIRENISVAIVPPDTIKVDGEYFFSTAQSMPLSAPLYYPFPIDSAANYPCFIRVTDGRSAKTMPFTRQEQGISFTINCKAADTAEVIVLYKQRVKNQSGRYILTTTGAWGRPLVNSRYTMSIPQTLTLAYMSYECDTVVKSGNDLVYRFFKKQFMPDRDLSFTWTGPAVPLQPAALPRK